MTGALTSTAGNEPAAGAGLCQPVAEHAPLPMAEVEGAGLIVRYVNPAFCLLLDQSKQQLIGQAFRDVLPASTGCLAVLERVWLSRIPASHTEPSPFEPHSDSWCYAMWPVVNHEHPISAMIQVSVTEQFHDTTLRAMNEALIVSSMRQRKLSEATDAQNAQLLVTIDERKHVDEALQREQELLAVRAALRSAQLEDLVSQRTSQLTLTSGQVDTFVYSIAHDLRAPLRAMQGFAVMLLNEIDPTLSAMARDYAQRINRSAQFMDAMLCDLLAFSGISQQRLNLTAVPLQSVVESVMDSLQADIARYHAQVDSSGPWPVVLAHEPTLALALYHLMTNALKFAGADQTPVVRLRAEERPEVIRVWVDDNGPGIAPDHQSQIFRLFTRLDGEAHPGTGAGLALVKKSVERMGGRVGVESEIGHGSHVWLDLCKA